jgi:aldehyde:ferredoxin oxidoreductase
MIMAKMVTIDLTTGKITKDTVDSELEKKFIGGWGVSCALAFDLIKPGIDPFAPENPIIISTGSFNGTSVPSANKISAITKCPVQASKDGRHFIGWGSGGSAKFARTLRQAGYDYIVLTGKAARPSYVYIEDDAVEICDAADLWEKKDNTETVAALTERHEGCGTITIGRAGESLVRYALALVDDKGTLGREGVGAVMGSKNLKAVAAKGSGAVTVADKELLKQASKNLRNEGIHDPGVKAIRQLGAHAGWENWIDTFTPGVWPRSKWDDLYGVEKFKEVKGKSKPCQGCYVGCRWSLKVQDGEFAGLEIPSTHYLVMAVLAQRLEIEDHRQGIKLLDLCNRAGLCFFTTTNIVDFVTRLYADGKISQKETGGLALSRDFDMYLKLFTMIANREGLGDTLADGWYAASERVGVDAIHDHSWVGIVKGMDPIVDARFIGLIPMTFAYIVNPRAHHGNVHCIQYGGNPIYEADRLKEDLREMGIGDEETMERIFTPTSYGGKINVGRVTKHVEDRGAITQSLGLCDNYCNSGWLPMSKIAECYSAVTGIETTPEELKKAGERICNLNKALNVREGFSREDDIVPAWFIPVNAPEGIAEMKDYYKEKTLSKDDVMKLLDDYYDERGWDKERGVPTKEKLAELGLGEYAS